ncbi:TlpA family protein disulfide reductase [Ancylomarina longa]|uniref:DUF5106 domain-containing protein n=1 Tax=Ancylomarina longa TaxID=2487017 RepID=A0A434AX28_9BACT|nr:TlpA family protein disulfide reductase [Ancylomarina longa]RUT79086.1 DUF5106 domain-containing protein [Ancylomarina longa]
MKKIFTSFIALLISFTIFNSISAQKYRIAIQFSNTSDSTAYLAHYFDGRIFADDTSQLVNGKGLFSKDKVLDQGIYVIYLQGQKYFDLLIGEDQQFEIKADPADFIGSIKITGSEESKAFHDFQQFMKSQNTKSKKLQESFKANANNPEEKKKYREAYKNADLEVRNYIASLKSKFNTHSFLSKFAQLTLTPQVPDFSKNIPDSIVDRDKLIQKKSYLYNKDHFFDYVDFSDDRFLRTPILKNKLDFFYGKILVQSPDTIVKESNKLIEAARANHDFFQYLTQYSLNYAVKSKIMGMDAAFVKLAKKYYLSGQASWADSTLLSNIREQVIKLQFNLIGEKGQDLTMETPEGEYIRLSEVDAPYTILYFWEPDCGHCKKSTPKLKTEIYDKFKDKGVKIFAVCTQNEKEKWKNFIADHDLFGFMNCYDPHYQTNFRIYYDVFSTPTIYLLDKDKKIIAKRLDIETLKTFLENKLNKEKN